MILEAKFITKENSKEFSNRFLDDTIKCTRDIKLGMWSMENQLICLSYINAHFILLGLVTNVSKLLIQGAIIMPRNQ